MKFPILIINFKAYENSYGEKALQLSKSIDKVARESGIEIVVAVPSTMIHRISKEVSIPVFAQHVDAVPEGAHTGAVTPEMIKEAGAAGTLVNHSERRVRADEIDDVIKRSRRLGLETVVCVDRYELVVPIGLLGPDAILVEPPELIGTGVSVSRARPEVITNAVEMVQKVKGLKLIVGAGISTGDDVYTSIKLGAHGIGVASAVMKSKDPSKVVREFVEGAKRAVSERITGT